MARRGATLGLSLLLAGTVACDSAGENEGCSDRSDLSACPRSAFSQQAEWARDVSGIVRRGEDPVTGARVRISATQGSISAADPFTADVSTDRAGFYRVFGPIPAVYDLSFVLPDGPGGRFDVLVYRDVMYRYFEPQLDVPGRSLPRAWTGHVNVRLEEPLAEGQTLLFLAAGEGVYGVTGDLERGLDVHTARFEQSANIRAVAYDAAKGLISASAYARADVISDAGTPKSITLKLEPITNTAQPTFTIDLPPGFVPKTVDIRIASSRTSDALLASVPWGEPFTMPLVPDQGYNCHVRATRADGAISDTGEQGCDPLRTIAFVLPAPPDPVLPESGATIGAGEPLTARGAGILEDVLEPQASGAPSIRIVRFGLDGSLPDLRALGVEKGTGNYTWTVRRFSTAKVVENLTGPDSRRYRPVAISPPRTLVLR